MVSKENVNKQTGEVTPAPVFNEVIVVHRRRPDGTLEEGLDFSNCVSLSEQHTAHLSDINYLMERYKPDELAAYIAARTQYRQEIIGHDFAAEPDLQDAKNIVYQSKQQFEELSDEIKSSFRNHVEFLKFIDNPANAEKMLKLGILKPRELQKLLIPEPNQQSVPNQPLQDPQSTKPNT